MSVDISAGGLLLNTNEELDVGDNVKISFLIPNSFKFFNGVGEVVRTNIKKDDTSDIAIKFTDMNMDKFRELDYYLCSDIVAI